MNKLSCAAGVAWLIFQHTHCVIVVGYRSECEARILADNFQIFRPCLVQRLIENREQAQRVSGQHDVVNQVEDQNLCCELKEIMKWFVTSVKDYSPQLSPVRPRNCFESLLQMVSLKDFFLSGTRMKSPSIFSSTGLDTAFKEYFFFILMISYLSASTFQNTVKLISQSPTRSVLR